MMRKVIVIRRSSWPDRVIGLCLMGAGAFAVWWLGFRGLVRMAFYALGPVLGMVRGLIR
jgi:hypothetical protein